jgi:hypothetical protein
MENKYCDEDLIRAFKCRVCDNYVCKDEAFHRQDDGVIRTCICLECSTNEYQKLAETHKPTSQSIWEASIQNNKLREWLDNQLLFLEDAKEEEKPKINQKIRQIKEAIKGPHWLRKERGELNDN